MASLDSKTDISRAIRRSRKARAAMQRRRRRSAAIAGLLAVAVGGSGIWSIGALTGNDMVQAAVAKAQDLADLIGQRSPGQRTETRLTKTKQEKPRTKVRLAAKPHPAAAPKVPMTDIAQLLQAPPPVTIAAPAQPAFPKLTLATLTPSIGAIVSPPPGGGGTPGGSSTPSSFPGPESKVPITGPSAVPEPGTWATMLLGFALIGWRIRRSGRAQPKALQTA